MLERKRKEYIAYIISLLKSFNNKVVYHFGNAEEINRKKMEESVTIRKRRA